jgi:Tfp pilus assembly protein PilO
MKFPDISTFKLDNKKILLIALAVSAIVYADCSFVVRAQLDHLRSLRPKVAKLKKDIAAFNKGFAEIGKSQNKQKEPPITKQIISESELPDLLEYISESGNKNNVRITQIRPAIKEEKAKDGKPAAATQLTPAYISLDIFSNYHSLGGFLNTLENGEKFIAVQDLKIARDKSDYMRQEVKLTLKTYVKK